MKKTKVIVKKDSKKSTKQKQKQSVNVNVHIDQSKRVTQRKPKLKPDSAVNPTTTLPHGGIMLNHIFHHYRRLFTNNHNNKIMVNYSQ